MVLDLLPQQLRDWVFLQDGCDRVDVTSLWQVRRPRKVAPLPIVRQQNLLASVAPLDVALQVILGWKLAYKVRDGPFRLLARTATVLALRPPFDEFLLVAVIEVRPLLWPLK